MLVNANRRAYPLGVPKTGQTTSYATGDDGTFEPGWRIGRLNSTNLSRFITATLSGKGVVIDRATGLMWAAIWGPANGSASVSTNWADAIAWADGVSSLSFAGFSDWRVPTIKEIFSVAHYAKTKPHIDSAFTLADDSGTEYVWWSSTTHNANTTLAWGYDSDEGIVNYYTKTNSSVKAATCVRRGL